MDANLSQEELDALLNSLNIDGADDTKGASSESASIDDAVLTSEEIDAIGEIANICSGSSATNLSAVLNQRVNITTPYVTLESVDELISATKQPCVLVRINYIEGIEGSNIQILQEDDVRVITDLMLGGDGTNISALGDELTDLHMSALCEAMNQMTGASATSLYTMLNRKVDISPPDARLVDFRDVATRNEVFGDVNENKYVKVSFKLEIGDLVDSSFMQIYTIDFAKHLYSLIGDNSEEAQEEQLIEPEVPAVALVAEEEKQSIDIEADSQDMTGSAIQQPMDSAMPGFMPPVDFGNAVLAEDTGVVIQPAQFNEFDGAIRPLDQTEQIGIINDVSLEIAVELGKTQKTVREILDFEEGTLIELNRLAGEMMDILVNGKVLAKGEIVVLEDKFAVQLKEINTI